MLDTLEWDLGPQGFGDPSLTALFLGAAHTASSPMLESHACPSLELGTQGGPAPIAPLVIAFMGTLQ